MGCLSKFPASCMEAVRKKTRLFLEGARADAIMETSSIKEFVHHKLGEEVRAVGGEYTMIRESRLVFGGKELLYLVGCALFDTSCCGVGGCGYAIVPGFIRGWKIRQTPDGEAVSLVEPIENSDVQKEITEIIIRREMVQQVQFEF